MVVDLAAAVRAVCLMSDLHVAPTLAGLHCSVVGGTALRKLTQVVPDRGLPMVDSVPDALRRVEGVIRACRQFVSAPARQEEPQCTATACC